MSRDNQNKVSGRRKPPVDEHAVLKNRGLAPPLATIGFTLLFDDSINK
jgi:hypothetical protein